MPIPTASLMLTTETMICGVVAESDARRVQILHPELADSARAFYGLIVSIQGTEPKKKVGAARASTKSEAKYQGDRNV
jgi:hypothetical protein